MGGSVPDILIPAYWSGLLRFQHFSTVLTLPATTTARITYGPSTASDIWLVFRGNSGRPRVVATGDFYEGTGAGLRHWMPPLKAGQLEPVVYHTDYLVPSVFEPDYPLFVPISNKNLMVLELFNSEAYAISWDLTFWQLECDATAYETEIMPYLRRLLKGKY